MGTPYLAEIKVVSFNFAPKGWAFCNGQLLPINQNQALFSILGTTYGGNGQTNFALPNLQGRVPIHCGAGFILGQSAGEYSAHADHQRDADAHALRYSATATGTQVSPANNLWAGDARPARMPVPPTSPCIHRA